MANAEVEAYRLLIADVYELAGLSRRTSEEFTRRSGGQTVARWHVMSAISQQPATVPAIARRLGHRRQSVQRLVDDLTRCGSAEPRVNAAHRRSPLIALTAEGRRQLRTLNAAAEQKRAGQLATAHLDAEQLTAARATLRALITALSGPDGPGESSGAD